jgi:hypothetical protein
MAFPFLPIAMVLSSVLPSLFSSGNDAEQTSTTTTNDTGYKSPMLGLLDPYITKALMANLGRLQGAGYPKGLQSLGLGGMNTDIFSLLSKEWPSIMAAYNKTTPTGGGASATVNRSAV